MGSPLLGELREKGGLGKVGTVPRMGVEPKGRAMGASEPNTRPVMYSVLARVNDTKEYIRKK